MKKQVKEILLRSLFLLSSLTASSAFATTEESPKRLAERLFEALSSQLPRSTPALDPYESYVRTLAVFDHFQVPSEPDTQPYFNDLQGSVDSKIIQSRLAYLDLHRAFSLFGRVSNTDTFDVYQDRESNRVLDYSVRLASAHAQASSTEPYRAHLLNALKNPTNLPLAGLRIALDPGHMGGDFWDEKTGKFVHDRKGRKLSEGVLALQISMLLEKSLTALGAQVKITRYHLAPVTTLPYESFDLRERALLAVREDSLSPWFQSLLSTSVPGQKLYQAFEESSRFKNLFSNSQRWDYYIEGYDLDARVDSINEFNPDLTLIIHLDAGNIGPDSNGVNPKPYDGTKVYVPGAFFSNEFTSRDDRKFFGRHLLGATSWSDSVQLARSLAHHLHDGLGIGYDKTDIKNSIEIEPGVMARNLRVQRRLTSQATAYVECLYYNDPREFEALLKTTHSMTIDGKEMPYSDRLEQIATSIRDGILDFSRSFH